MSKSDNEGTVIRHHLGPLCRPDRRSRGDVRAFDSFAEAARISRSRAGFAPRRVQSVRRVRVIDPVAVGDRVVFS